MEEQAINQVSHLANYGVLGIFSILMIVVIYFMWKHLREREKHHEERHIVKEKEQSSLTQEFLRAVADFKTHNAIESAANREALRELKDVIHSKL